MPSSIVSRLQRSSSTVPRDERAISRKRGMIRRSKKTKDRLIKAANRLLPIFVEHALWRPKERAWIGNVMRDTDIRRLQEDVTDGIRMASSLGLDVSDIELPFAA